MLGHGPIWGEWHHLLGVGAMSALYGLWHWISTWRGPRD